MNAIIFDLDETLLSFTLEYRELLAKAFEDVEGRVTEERLEAYDEAFFDRFGRFEPDPVERAFATLDGCDDPTAYASALLEREIEHTRPPPTVHQDLERLGESFRLGVLTNGVPDWQRRKLAAHELDRHFDAVLTSYEVGAHKPDPEPFRALEARLPAEAYAMVGDHDADVDGARRTGWNAYRYEGGGFGDLPDVLGWE